MNLLIITLSIIIIAILFYLKIKKKEKIVPESWVLTSIAVVAGVSAIFILINFVLLFFSSYISELSKFITRNFDEVILAVFIGAIASFFYSIDNIQKHLSSKPSS